MERDEPELLTYLEETCTPVWPLTGSGGAVIRVLSHPDRYGRVRYTRTRRIQYHPTCPRCGRSVNDANNPTTKCGRCGVETLNLTRTQYFFGLPPSKQGGP